MTQKLSSSSFRGLIDNGKRLVTPFAIVYLRRGNCGWGVIASKKVGSAVSRNRAKRLLREYMRTNVSRFCGKEILLIARRDLVDRTFRELSQSLDQIVNGEIDA